MKVGLSRKGEVNMKENQSGFTMIVDSILFCELYLLGKITYQLV
ncbi:hypothetical protein C1A50_5230 [Paenibacillus polymyxa]|nr:hypothetical protein C1A50_5230 [Paenibacillus polymyxa]